MTIGDVVEAYELGSMMEAQERLGILMDNAAAVGNLKRGAHGRHMRDLRRQARGKRQHRPEDPEASGDDVRVQTVGEVEAELAAVGVGLVTVDG